MPAISLTKTNTGRNLFRSGAKGTLLPKVMYIALGTDSTTPTATDTMLGNEFYRRQVSAYTDGTTGQLYVDAYIPSGEANGYNVQKVGIFAGPTATGNANSGTLIAVGLYAYGTKTNGNSITLQFILTF